MPSERGEGRGEGEGKREEGKMSSVPARVCLGWVV